MSSASSSEDEFEQFRARAYSGGNILSLQQLRNEQKQGKECSRRSLCPADEDSSDSDDGQERISRTSDKHEGSKQRHSRNGTLKVPRSYRSRSLSPSFASTIAARNRARLKAEQLRQLLAKQSQDSQDEPVVNRNIDVSPKHMQVMKKRSFDICFPQTYTDLQEKKAEGPLGIRYTYRRRSDADHLYGNLKPNPYSTTPNGDRNWELGEMRPRVSSMPSETLTQRSLCIKVPSIHSFAYDNRTTYRIREFQLTPKGNVISKGSYLSQSNTSVESGGSTTASATSLVEGPYNVYLMGIPGVGIRAIISTFIAEQFEDVDSSGRCILPFF